ncbi:MAG: ribosome biogenesis factor YjgA [Desulfocapsaceae bacterium]|jgi:ribosome-associated protein|nr:ribosome biogenesis factor YjgA [Desulfocapsaceae bacterium]
MEERVSRSEQKRRFRQIESAAREVSELRDPELGRLPVSDELRDEIVLCRKTKAGARKRQIKYIAKILHHEDLGAILRFLQDKKGSKLKENKFLHEAERLRDQIVDDALSAHEMCRHNQEAWELDWQSEAIDHALSRFPDLDERELRNSAHHYARTRSKTHYRELFRMIKAAAEKNRLREKKEQPSGEGSPESQDLC